MTISLTEADKEAQAQFLLAALDQFVTITGRGWSIVTFFRAANTSKTQEIIFQRHREGLDLAYHHSRLKKVLKVPYDITEAVNKATQLEVESAAKAVPVAALTIWHTGFEEYLLKLLRLGAVCNRPAVLKKVKDRKVSISRMKEAQLEGAENDLIEDWLKEVGNESLLIRWTQVFSVTPPTIPVAIPYDEDWLGRFDAARHDGVHHGGEIAAAFDLDEANTRLFFYSFSLAFQYADSYQIDLKWPT